MSDDRNGADGRIAPGAGLSASLAPLTYAYHPRLGGAGVRLVLGARYLEWTVGPREGRLRLADVARLHLTFAPAKFAASSFETRIEGRDGTRIRMSSTSRVSLTNVRDQGADYAVFVRALHQAAVAAGARPRCRGGYAPWRWWVMVCLGALVVLGLVGVVAFTLLSGQWTLALGLALFSLAVAWPMAEALWRNTPVDYAPGAPPERLLPD